MGFPWLGWIFDFGGIWCFSFISAFLLLYLGILITSGFDDFGILWVFVMFRVGIRQNLL